MTNNQTSVLTVLLNGEQAQQELESLKVKAKTLALSIDDARKAGNHTFAKELTKDLRQTSKEMCALEKQTIDVNQVLKNLSTAKPKELSQTLAVLTKQLNSGKIARGSQEWDKLNGSIRKVRAEMAFIKSESQVAESALSRVANTANKYFNVALSGVAAITGASFAMRKMAEDVAKMDDKYADVMKTTGMTRDEVVDLNEEFKTMDTRTAREELNNLARDAGKLGISMKEEVAQFVEAGNIINVSLGEDLGEGAIKNIGKITDIYRMSTKELDNLDLKGRMLAIGSAINELGQSSTANEAYLVNFTQRLGGVASQAGISVQNILGYASALDQSGQAVEMSATALQKFIMKLMGEPAKFAQIAGLEVGKFNNLLKTDTNQAIKTVLQALSEKGGFQQLIPVFQEMGMDGARAVGVLSSLATNIGKVDEAQRISNGAFSDGTSVIDEYSVKNNNLMAQLEKRKKEFKDASLELGERLNPALLKSTNAVTYLVKILPGVLDFFTKFGPSIVKVTALILAYNVGIKAQTVWTKLQIIDTAKLIWWYGKESAQMTILSLKYLFASRSAAQLQMSLRGLFATLNVNPWGAAIAAIVAIGYGVWKWSSENAKLLTSQIALVDINNKAAKGIASERAELDLLLGVAKNEKISKEERVKAIKKLNEISPEYLGNLDLENINTDKATIAVDKYTKALLENAKQKAIAEKVSELYGKQMDAEIRYAEAKAKLDKTSGRGDTVSFGVDLKRGYQERKVRKEVEEIKKEIKIYSDLNEAMFANKKAAENSHTAKAEALFKEKQLLEQLEQKHAELYAKSQEQKPLFDANSFADQAQLNMATERLKRQRAIVEAKEKELAETKKIVKTEEEGGDSPTSPTGGGGKEESVQKQKERALKLSYDKQLLNLKTKLKDERITQDEYHNLAYLAELLHLQEMKQLRDEFGEDTTDIEIQITDKLINESNRRYELLKKIEADSKKSLKDRPQEEAEDESYDPQGYGDEKLMLDIQREDGTLSEEEYQEALYDLKAEYLDKYFEKYEVTSKAIADITQSLGGAMENFQRSEEMAVTTKYDKQIKAAGNNAAKVAELEEKKEAELHAIRAKYADMQFVITVANVIATTAVSAMEAYKAMAGIPIVGPALGAIAAGAAIAFGASQIAVAKQQKDAAKAGYADGGFTPLGQWDEPQGTVHSEEFVGNRFAVRNPTVRKIFNIVDMAQKNNTVGSLSDSDFSAALNYREHSQRKMLSDAFSSINRPDGSGGAMSMPDMGGLTIVLDKLSRKLDDPLVAETYIEGKGGSKRANDLYDKMKNNVSRRK